MMLLKTLIKKQTISISIALLIIVLGFFAVLKMPIRLFPEVTLPVISITTAYPGADADVVKSHVTSRLEKSLSGLPNINYITSASTKGMSTIKIDLMPDSPIESSMIHIMEKIHAAKSHLPVEVESPLVMQDAETSAAMIIAYSSQTMSRVQTVDYLERMIVPELQNIDGVGEVSVMGPSYALKIHLNPALLTAYSLTASDVLDALKQQNVLSQTGNLEGDKTNFTLDTLSHFDNPTIFNHLLIKEIDGHAIRLSDIGKATFTAASTKSNAFYQGKSSVMIFVNLISGANPLIVSKKVKQALSTLKGHMPYDLKSHIVVNVADYIHDSIDEVWHTLWVAFLVIIFVLIFFLGSFSAMSIPLLTIPISLIGGLFLMHLVGFSINTLTLLAMVLAVGLVVDDAIVVVENIFRYLPHTQTREQAAYQGTQEIMGPVIAMTLTLSAVFVPVFFIGGVTGRLFSEFAFAMAASVLVSGFVSLTLTPMMCAKILPQHDNGKKIWSHRIMPIIQKKYLLYLDFILRKKCMALSFWIISIIGCFMLYHITPKELAPQEDLGFLMVMGNGPTHANQHYILDYRDEIEKKMSSLPYYKEHLLLQGMPSLNGLMAFIAFSNDKKRPSTTALQPILQNTLKTIMGINAYVILPSQLPGDSGSDFQCVIMSNTDYKQLHSVAKRLERAAMKTGLFAYLNDDLHYNQPHIQLKMNRHALEAHHITMNTISSTLALLTGEFESQQLTYFGRSYDIIVSAAPQFRHHLDQLNAIMVKNNHGHLIPLSDLMSTHLDIQPSSLNAFQQQNAVTLTGVLAPHISLSEAMHVMQQLTTDLLPDTMHYDYLGSTRQYQEENARFIQVFCLSIIVIFLILSIQFNRFRDAALILLGSVPLSLCVALIPLALQCGSINIYTQIALLTLVGLITKHGVLMTQFANQLKEQGVDNASAIRQAAFVRFRPILMTTVAMALGALPLVMAQGASSVSRFQMGLTLFVGISMGTVCTLFIFPVLFQLFSKKSCSISSP